MTDTDDDACPCPTCGYDCRTQAQRGSRICPECGGRLPDVRWRPNRPASWGVLLRGQLRDAVSLRHVVLLAVALALVLLILIGSMIL